MAHRHGAVDTKANLQHPLTASVKLDSAILSEQQSKFKLF